MTDCTAKFTSAEVTDEVVAKAEPFGPPHAAKTVVLYDIPDGVTVQRQGDRLVAVDLHELECTDRVGYPQHHVGDVSWRDGVPGATPHVDIHVSDAEVDAMVKSLFRPGVDASTFREVVRAGLLAAKRAEKEQS